MTEFNVTAEFSSGNILFKNASGSEIGYIDGDNTSIVAVGSLVASSSCAITGGVTSAGSLVASSSFAATGNATISASLIASSSASIAGMATVSGSLVASSSASVAGAATVSGSLIASSSASVAGGQTVSGSLIASSSAAITGQATISGSLVASSSASVAGGATISGSLVASSSVSVTGGVTVGSVTIPYGGFNCPEIRGRVDFDITTNATVGVCGGLVNPTTLVLLIDKVYTRVTTASSAGNALSLGVVATYTSGSNIADATIATNATGIVGLNSSTPFPVEWSTGYYLVAYKALGSTAIVAKVSAFYVGPVST